MKLCPTEDSNMKTPLLAFAAFLLVVACATDEYYDPLRDYEEVEAVTILDAPTPAGVAPENQAAVARGEYLIELLGCGSCHTDGALFGEPVIERSLAGSTIGIAYTNPLEYEHPGIVYAPNLTPDVETGIDRWSDQQIVAAIRAGQGRHGERRILVMPWQGYAKISNEDAWAIVGYLRSLEPVNHRVPEDVLPGHEATDPFVHFGFYRTR